MAQESVTPGTSTQNHEDTYGFGLGLLGPILCWALVFANIGSSVYYVPAILYESDGSLAGFFLLLTLPVFVLLSFKYAEVSHRFPQGGGVVTVAAQSINRWAGAMGGMLILVDYFLTIAISVLSAAHYLSLIFPAIGSFILEIAIVLILLMGLLNWISSTIDIARVAIVIATIAFASDIAILITVFSHISFGDFLALFPRMFQNHVLGPTSILVGFAGSFLAISGLESISQLTYVMRVPRMKVAGIALLLVVLTIGITSPLLTMLSTLLLPKSVVDDPTLSAQVISLLGGKFGGIILQTEVTISASMLLLCAATTAIFCVNYVLTTLVRIEFFPAFVLQRNRLRGTNHYSIALSTGIPIVLLLLIKDNINMLGQIYAFGLLGAFTLTSLGLDIIRYRERKVARALAKQLRYGASNGITNDEFEKDLAQDVNEVILKAAHGDNLDVTSHPGGLEPEAILALAAHTTTLRARMHSLWEGVEFRLGVLTTIVVLLAWGANIFSKPLATVWGGTAVGVGMLIAYFYNSYQKKRTYGPVVTSGIETCLPDSILVVLTVRDEDNYSLMRSGISNATRGNSVIFLYLGKSRPERVPSMFEVVDPYLEDRQAKEAFSRAETLARKLKVPRQYIYLQNTKDIIEHKWREIRPHHLIVTLENMWQFKDEDDEGLEPDRIRYELTSLGSLAHLFKKW